MILSFSQTINKIETDFVSKIIESLTANKLINEEQYNYYYDAYLDRNYVFTFYKQGKHHTIRKDISNRWKAGNNIHFTINVRTKNQFQFAPVVKCVSVQKLIIDYSEKSCEWYGLEPVISIDDKIIDINEMETLAKNDGFDTVEDFLEYFNKDFTGKIIHWTNLKY